LLTDHVQREIEITQIGESIRSRAEEQIGKSQREYLLREQLRAIQRELGEETEQAREVSDIRKRIEEAELPSEARQEAERELNRLEQLPAISPEHGIILTYLDWRCSA
ncbi:MAG TPA: endopeptidase La, partial [Chloroflexota bacterium]|nr:endopeptidase La [Chloroflexota bacterium]